METIVKNIIGIFTILDGKVNVLTHKSNLIDIYCNDEIDIINQNYIKNNLDIRDLNLKQCCTLSKKYKDKLNIYILFIDIINSDCINLNDDYQFVPIEKLNKNTYIEKMIEYLKKDLILTSTLKKIYPDEFTLPEIQKIYEDIFNKKIDRRNFRKKLIKFGVIEDLDRMSNNKKGRPAKLYRFKEIKDEKILL